MSAVDIVILALVVIVVTLIIYFRFIKNRGKSACASCDQSSRYSKDKLREYYDKVKDKK